MLATLDFRQLPVTFFSPKTNLPPLRDAQEILFPKRFRGSAVRLDHIRMPSDPHVVDDVESHCRQLRCHEFGASQAGTRLFETMSDDAVVRRF